MRYSSFIVVLKDGGQIEYKDDRDSLKIYDLKYPASGALLVEMCDGNHLDQEPLKLPSRGGSVHELMAQLEGAIGGALQHEHKFVVMYAPGTWVRVEFGHG